MFEKKVKDESPAIDLSSLSVAGGPASEPEPKLRVPPQALTPEVQAFMNTSISATIKEIFAGMQPMLASIALTPEKIEQMEAARRAPTEDERARKAREKREKALQKEEIDQNRKNLKASQENCLHRYVNGSQSISAVRNYPDRQTRFICHLCMSYFEPRHWEVGILPTAENPHGSDKIVDASPLYVQIFKEWSLSHQS
jgi:hypothetical protein